MSAPTVTPAARRLAKAAGVRPVAAQRVLDGLEVWPGTYEAVSAVALACGVVDLPPPAPRASRRPPPRPCPACAAKDRGLAKLTADVERLAEGIGIAQRERGKAKDELAKSRAHLVEQMQDWKRQWLEACDERDTARSEVTALRARVAELEARPVAAAEQRRQEREARLRERGYDQDPPRDPFVAPPTRPAPRPRCHVTLEHDGVDLLAVTTPAEAAG